jgi:hypothetical protein
MKAVQTTEALGFEPIDLPPHVDDVRAQLECRDPVDGLVDECVDSVMQTGPRVRDRERFHGHILPNICSPPYGPNTDKVVPVQV